MHVNSVGDFITTSLSCCSTDSDTGPMSKWNRDALVSLQGDLKLNVLMKTGLVNKLQKAADGFMDEEEAQSVESKPDNSEQMGQLIRILLGKSNADFIIFCTMLRQCNYSLWADALERKAREFREEPGMQVFSDVLPTPEHALIHHSIAQYSSVSRLYALWGHVFALVSCLMMKFVTESTDDSTSWSAFNCYIADGVDRGHL